MKPNLPAINTAGALLAGLYALASAACVAMALSTGDPKGGYVFLQLPIALQTALLPEPVLRLLEHISWPTAYALLGLPTLAALYLLGAAGGRLLRDVAS